MVEVDHRAVQLRASDGVLPILELFPLNFRKSRYGFGV